MSNTSDRGSSFIWNQQIHLSVNCATCLILPKGDTDPTKKQQHTHIKLKTNLRRNTKTYKVNGKTNGCEWAWTNVFLALQQSRKVAHHRLRHFSHSAVGVTVFPAVFEMWRDSNSMGWYHLTMDHQRGFAASLSYFCRCHSRSQLWRWIHHRKKKRSNLTTPWESHPIESHCLSSWSLLSWEICSTYFGADNQNCARYCISRRKLKDKSLFRYEILSFSIWPFPFVSLLHMASS